jgi:hypothetical protein
MVPAHCVRVLHIVVADMYVPTAGIITSHIGRIQMH